MKIVTRTRVIRAMRNVTTNEQDIDKKKIECYEDAIRDAYELEKYDSGTVDDYGLLLNEAIDGAG